MWFKCLVLHLCPKLNFPSKRQFSQDTLPRLVEKTIEVYVFHALAECYYATTIFNLWMSKGGYDMFTLVVNFLSNNW
jgi:hypothetical protein